MIKKFCIITGLLFLSCPCFGANIVYPSSENAVINSPTTFFIGNENPEKTLVINGSVVKMHPSGGFKYPVSLDYGENTFFIDNGDGSVKEYNITRPYPVKSTASGTPAAPINYDKNIVIKISNDNTPLRSTPVDSGLNRLQHLQKGIEFEAIGEERNFYKVKLGRDDFGFISKDNSQKTTKTSLEPAQLLNETSSSKNSTREFEFTLDKQVPYTISESNDGLDIVIYNIAQTPFLKYEKHVDGKIFGYNSYYDGNKLVITVKNQPKINPACPLKGLNVTVDPGHGGSESGAVGCLGTLEKDVNLDIALNLKNKLQNKGANVFMTREDDNNVSLSDRVKITNNNDSDIFISIHNNSQPDSQANNDASGTETYYFYPQSKKLALQLANSISKETGFKNGGARGQSFAVVRNTSCPAVLLEIGYMINPEDNSKLIDTEFQDKITDGIIKGLESYLNDL